MDFKKIKTENAAITRTMREFSKGTNNVYETVAILSKRADQISTSLKKELNERISDFSITSDSLDEVFENKEQIEIAKFYERLPKPTLMAIWEYEHDKLYFKNPVNDSNF